MKIEKTRRQPRGLVRVVFDLNFKGRNVNRTDLMDPLKYSAPSMLPIASASRVTGQQAIKYAGAESRLLSPVLNQVEQAGSKNTLVQRSGNDAYNFGQFARKGLGALTDGNFVKSVAVPTLLGGLAGYGAGKLTHKNTALTTIGGALLSGYLSNAAYRNRMGGSEITPETLYNASTKTSAGLLDRNYLVRQVAQTAVLRDQERRALIAALENMPEGKLQMLLHRIGPGLTGAGLVSALFALLFGRGATGLGAVAGYLGGNLVGAALRSRYHRNEYDMYGRPIVI